MKIRRATSDDLDTVLQFTKELAIYERDGDTLNLDPDFFRKNILADDTQTECYLILSESNEPVGMGEIFTTLSTYTSSYKLNLQDFYVREADRGKGYGKFFMKFLAEEARKRGCITICWTVYKWNDNARRLYDYVGKFHDDVAVYSMNINAK